MGSFNRYPSKRKQKEITYIQLEYMRGELTALLAMTGNHQMKFLDYLITMALIEVTSMIEKPARAGASGSIESSSHGADARRPS